VRAAEPLVDQSDRMAPFHFDSEGGRASDGRACRLTAYSPSRGDARK